jgi:hypothetical protein
MPWLAILETEHQTGHRPDLSVETAAPFSARRCLLIVPFALCKSWDSQKDAETGYCGEVLPPGRRVR